MIQRKIIVGEERINKRVDRGRLGKRKGKEEDRRELNTKHYYPYN